MKTLITFFIFFIGAQSIISQTVVSSCSASDSVKALYIDDADRLALKRIYQQNLSYTNSIVIPQAYTDTVLKALIAVYNATMLPSRNAVVSQHNIHTFPNPVMNALNVAADSTLPWMHQLKLGNIPTGNTQVDNLISTYSLTIQYYHTYSGLLSYHVVTFQSDSNYNMQPLTDLFENIPNVTISETVNVVGDGNDIWASIYSNYTQLTYFFKWGDCPAGCTAMHAWMFNVYHDCSVQFAGEYGTPLPIVPIPTISVSGSNCINETLIVNILGADYALLNNQLITPQFTLSSPTPTAYVIWASKSIYPVSTSTSISVSIVDCSTPTTSINENNLYSNISIYPNPVYVILNVEFGITNEKTEIKIINVLGKEVMNEETKNGTAQINVVALPNGIYFIKAENVVRKFVKE